MSFRFWPSEERDDDAEDSRITSAPQKRQSHPAYTYPDELRDQNRKGSGAWKVPRLDSTQKVVQRSSVVCICAKDEELNGLYKKFVNYSKTHKDLMISDTLQDWDVHYKRFKIQFKDSEVLFVSMSCQGIQAFSIRFTLFASAHTGTCKFLFFGVCGSPTESLGTLCYCDQAVNITEGKISDDIMRNVAAFSSHNIGVIFPEMAGVKTGTMLTTNFVRNDGVPEFKDIKKLYRNSIAVDTESSAFFEVLSMVEGTNLGVLKAVCDNCKDKNDSKMNECYDALAGSFISYIFPNVFVIQGSLLSDSTIGMKAIRIYEKMLECSDNFASVKMLIFDRKCHVYLSPQFVKRTLRNLGLVPLKNSSLVSDGKDVFVYPEMFDTELTELPQETFLKLIASIKAFAKGHGFDENAFVTIPEIKTLFVVEDSMKEHLLKGHKPGDPIPKVVKKEEQKESNGNTVTSI